MSEQISDNLQIGHQIIRYAEVDSTNQSAKDLIANSEPLHGTVILAEFQKKGRGQSKNTWQSRLGQNILASIILKPSNLLVEQQFIVNQLISVAIAEALNQFTQEEVFIKWPNDILIDKYKVCGLLIENILSGHLIRNMIIGFGLNVNQSNFDNLSRASSLKLITGLEFDREEILNQILIKINHWVEQFNKNQFGLIRRQYLSKLFQYQEVADYWINEKKVQGEIIGVDETGQLKLRIGNQLHSFGQKEIAFLY